jgi:deoxycytidine triphosphate deaminase
MPADWLDPDAETRGMLSADRIQFYVHQARMIDPFDPARLKPASYALSLGPTYLIEDELQHLTPLNPTLRIPQNSIVFVAMREVLRLPHYIAARFNLSIDLVYQGLLLGTGPQVDPGFQGVLSCPLHNISNEPIRINLGDHLATIDFIKTSGIGEESEELLRSIRSEEELYEQAPQLIGHGGYDHRLFPESKRWLRPIVEYTPHDVGSSVAELENDVRRLRNIGIVGLVSLVIAVLLAFGPMFVDLKNDIQDAREGNAETRVELTRLEERLEGVLERLSRQSNRRD